MTVNDMLDLIRKRRSIRKYSDEPITEEQLELLLDAASAAPSRLDRRPLHYLIIRSVETKAKLAEALRVRPYIEKAPVIIAVCASPELSNVWELDGSAAIENILLAATATGLGATWVGSKGSEFWSRTVDVLRNSLRMPTSIDVVSLVCVGHPAEEKRAYEPKEKLDPARIHYDHWDKLRL
jgi:nitroreductase